MRKIIALLGLICLSGCAIMQKDSCCLDQELTPAEYLHTCFLYADILERGPVDLESRSALQIKLHEALKMYGDDLFAAALGKEKPTVQVSVVNVMGLLNPSVYNEYPKTKHVLAAAPKV